MYAHIADLTLRLAFFPLETIGNGKKSINAATRPPIEDILDDARMFVELLSGPAFQTYIAATRGAPEYGKDSDTERFLGEELLGTYAQ